MTPAEHERRKQVAAELMLQRKPLRHIAAVLGCSVGHAAKVAKAVMDDWRAERHKALDAHIAEELARLQRLEDAIWERAAQQGRYLAIDRILAIMERRAKLLGLDAPARIDITQHVRVMAESSGLDPDEVLRAAEQIVAAGVR